MAIENGAHPLPWYVEPPHDYESHSSLDCSIITQHHAPYTVCDSDSEVICACNGEDEGREEAVLICTLANRAGPKVCFFCENPATCFGSYETGLHPGYSCDECCGHGNEDGHCEPIESPQKLHTVIDEACKKLGM